MRKRHWVKAQQHLQPREVNKDTHDRCTRALAQRAGLVKPEQRPLLERVIAAYVTRVPVHKHELERAMGIVGSLERTL